MRAARSSDRTQTTAGAISHRRPDHTYSTPSWCEPDRTPSARPTRRCGLPAAEGSFATDRPVRATIVDGCGVLSRDTALQFSHQRCAFLELRDQRPQEAWAPTLDVDQFGDLGSNHFHRVLRRVQPLSGAEQRGGPSALLRRSPRARQGSAGRVSGAPRAPLSETPRVSTRSGNAGVMRTRPAPDRAGRPHPRHLAGSEVL